LILLVENREPVRVASKKVLETSGYDLLVVERVSDALWIAGQYRRHIDFLIIQALPRGLNAGLLAHLFRCNHPETLTVFVAGTREEVLICNGSDRNTTVLDQPVSVKVVASAVGEVIAKLRRMNINDSEG
jgi:DNA-binding response OmpR family regulator